MPFRPRYTGLIERYRDRLPIHDDTRIISFVARMKAIRPESGEVCNLPDSAALHPGYI